MHTLFRKSFICTLIILMTAASAMYAKESHLSKDKSAAEAPKLALPAQPSSQDGGPMITILCYHHVDCAVKTELSVTSGQLNEQLDALLAAGFTFIDSKALENFYENNAPIPLKSALITFDDGNYDVYAHGYPLLKKRGIPFTVFAYPDNVKSGHKTHCMDWNDLKDMLANGVTIGSHTMTHPFLTDPPASVKNRSDYNAWLDNEIVNSKTELESNLGCAITEFAVPFGAFDQYIKERIQTAGYTLAFNVNGVNADIRSDRWNINRIIVKGTMTKEYFLKIATALPIYFSSNAPGDLSRMNDKKVTVSFEIDGAKSFKESTIESKVTSIPGIELRKVNGKDLFEANIELRRPFYEVYVSAKDTNGRYCRGAWLFMYNRRSPDYLKDEAPDQQESLPSKKN